MKLVLAAFSFAVMGCVDDVSTGGGQMEGMGANKTNSAPSATDHLQTRYSFVIAPDRSEKPANRMWTEHINDNLVDPAVFTSITAGHFCAKTGCVVAAVVDRWPGLAEITYFVNDTAVCKIYRDETGTIYSDCN